MKKKELIDKIMDFLNFDEQTVVLYLFLLEKPRSIVELESIFIDCNERLGVLLSRCLIDLYTDERNGGATLYFAIDPKLSLSAILLNEVWGIDSNIHSLELLETRSDLSNPHWKYHLYNDISVEIQALYRRQLPYVKEIVVIIKGPKKVASFVAERISETQKNIIAMVSPPQLMGEIVWQAVRDRMINGIYYKRITDFDEIIRHGFAISCHEVVSYNENIYIYPNGTLPEKFYILDEQYVVFFEKSSSRQKFLPKIQYLKNVGVAKQFLDRYNKILEKCLNFRALIPRIKAYREIFIQKARDNRLDYNQIVWLEDLFDNGVFYSKNKYDVNFVSQAIETCIDKNLIKLLPDGEPVANYCLSDIFNE